MAKTNETSSKPLEKRKKSLPDFAAWAQGMLKANEEDATSKQASLAGQMMLIATPIGNLGDITLRALWALSQADAILCEDTRVTGGMLHHYGIKKPLISCHDHNEESRIQDVLVRLAQGQTLAFVSDAGTPLISDPGFRLARACRQAGFTVTALPGASAVLTALACAGLATDRFMFVGFLPAKKTARCKALEELAALQATLVFYESPQRIADSLADMAQMLSGDREVVVARELTKLYEEVQTGTLSEVAAHFQQAETPKGEIVVLVSGAGDQVENSVDVAAALREALQTMSLRDAVEAVSIATGQKRKEIYQQALTLSKK